MRRAVNLPDRWIFRKGRVSRAWLGGNGDGEACELPHSWNETDTFQPGVVPYRGWAAYRREIDLEAPGAGGDTESFLSAGGFYGIGDIWIDGRRVARVDGQYLGFRVPLPDDCPPRFTLGIRLTNRCPRHVLPGIRDPDFILHGGLAGGLGLERLPRFRIDEDAVRISHGDLLSPATEISVECAVLNRSDAPRAGHLRIVLRNAAGHARADSAPVSLAAEPGGRAEAKLSLNAGRLRLWTPDDPVLYTVDVELTDEAGERLDCVSRRTGFRRAEFPDGAGFFLNGERMELFGCNRHEAMPGFGSALPPELQRDDARRLKNLGCNFVRLSHYPQHPAFLDACDELGLFVYAEIASWKSVRRGRWHAAAARQLEAMIRRDRHRPSVLLWGLANESRSRSVFLDLRDLAQRLDPDRAVIYAENHLYRAHRAGTVGIPDVWGLNYEFEAIDDAAAASRTGNLIVSEMGNYPPADRGVAEEERTQVDLLESGMSNLKGKPFVAGCLLWCFTDYATLRKRRYLRACGMTDAWRLPKRAAAWMRMLRQTTPFLCAYADWSLGRGGEARHVEVFTNALRVTAWSGGRPIAEARGPGRLDLHLPFDGGEVEVRGERPDGIARAVLIPWGGPHALDLRPGAASADAAARRTLDFTVTCRDTEGRIVRNFAAVVAVRCSGPARLRCFSPASTVRVADGVGRGFLTGTGEPGTAEIVAEAPDLVAARATVDFRGANEGAEPIERPADADRAV